MRHRDPTTGRFTSRPLPPPAPDPLLFPSLKAPRYRLRVFDRRWPWRRTLAEVADDAIASGNAGIDPVTRGRYLMVPAMVQQDPPPLPGTRSRAFIDCAETGWRRGG